MCVALALLALAACKQIPATKVIVYSKGKPTVNKDDLKIQVPENGSGAEDVVLQYFTEKNLSFEVSSGANKTTIEASKEGVFIINARPDTIVGSYQNYGAPKKATSTVSQDEIKQRIDSLEQLIVGKNVSAANRNFIVYPNTGVKLTNNPDAEVVAPFHQMTSVAVVEGKEAEVYRFYTTNEIREIIAKAKALQTAKPADKKK